MKARRRFLWSLIFGIAGMSSFPFAASAGDIATQTLAVGQVLRGHFIQERKLAGFANPLKSSGSFVLVPGTGLIWRGEKPFANTTVISSDGILQIANNQVSLRLPASRLPGLSHLYVTLGAAVSGNIKPLQQTFSVTQQSGGAQWKIVLKPLHPENAAMSQIKSLVLAGGKFVDSAEIDKGGGDVDQITFLDQHAGNADLTADEKSLFQALHK